MTKYFAGCKYSCQETSCPSLFYTVVTDLGNVYIEDFGDEIISTVFRKDGKMIGFSGDTIEELIPKIKKHLNSEQEPERSVATKDK